jgi:hypothetical protein
LQNPSPTLTLALALALALTLALAGCQGDDAPTGTAAPLLPPDTEPPVVSVGPLPAEQTSFRFAVPLRAADTGGSGVAGVMLWAADAWGDTVLVGTFTDTLAAFHADTSGAHGFWAVAVDSAGNHSRPSAVAATTVPDRVVIVDVMEEHYDITHAVRRYNLAEWGWGHGMGRRAFAPINFPQLIHPGEAGYPDPLRSFDTIGVTYGPAARAYPIGDIVAREVVNDTLSGVHFAATY